MTRTKKIGAAVLGLFLLTGTAWSMRPGSEGIARAARGDVVRHVVAPGIVEPAREKVALGFEAPGRVVEVLVEEGDRVDAGQVLARLDDRIARAQLARAEAALASAVARRDLSVRGSRPAEIRAAQAELEATQAQARDREVSLGRSQRLFAGGAISQAELDGARDGDAHAKALVSAADARLALVREGSRSEVRREATAAVAAAEADVELARVLLSQTELRAPAAGVVLRRSVEPGEQIVMTPPRVAFTVADTDALEVRVEVDESDVGLVAVGQRVFLTADAYGERRFPGTIVRTLGELGRKAVRLDDPHARTDTRVLEVIVSLDGAAGVPVGLRMDAHVQTLERRNVVTLPLAAIERGGDGAFVTVLSRGEKVRRPVRLGSDDGRVVEIEEGLAEGESVALP